MNKNALAFGIVGLLVGLAIGFSVANYLNRNSTPTQNSGTDSNLCATKQNEQINPSVIMPDIQLVLDKAKNEPDNFEAQMKAGEMYSKIQRFDTALDYYKKAQQIKPNDLQANIKLAGAYFDKKKYVEAEKYFLRALRIEPKNVDIRSDLGLTYYLRDPSDDKRAISEYRMSLEINPSHEPSLQNLSVVLKKTGDVEELKKTLARLKKVNPKNVVLERYGEQGSEK